MSDKNITGRPLKLFKDVQVETKERVSRGEQFGVLVIYPSGDKFEAKLGMSESFLSTNRLGDLKGVSLPTELEDGMVAVMIDETPTGRIVYPISRSSYLPRGFSAKKLAEKLIKGVAERYETEKPYLIYFVDLDFDLQTRQIWISNPVKSEAKSLVPSITPAVTYTIDEIMVAVTKYNTPVVAGLILVELEQNGSGSIALAS
jgi:hypothetical protein